MAVVAGAFLCGYNFTALFHEPTSLVGGLWAVISAIIVIEATQKETFNSAKKRIVGTLIGAILSGIYLLFFHFTIIGLLITIGIGVLVCLLFKLSGSVKLTIITISIILIVSTISKDLHPLSNAGLRFIESAIGTATAILVALIIYQIENIKKRKVKNRKGVTLPNNE